MSARLQITDLAVSHSGRPPLLQDLSLQAAAGEFITLIGRNGIGKTSLLRTLAGLLPAASGKALLDGEDLQRMPATHRARLVAVVVTDRITVPGMRVRDLVATGRHPHTGWWGRAVAADQRIVEDALVFADAQGLADRMVNTLSDAARVKVVVASVMRFSLEYPGNEVRPRRPNRAPG